MLQRFFTLGFVLLVVLLASCKDSVQDPKSNTIKVGIVHSLHGLFAANERPILNATLLAIEEINAAGGLLSCMVEPCLGDGQSQFYAFEQEAHRLIEEKNVAVIFGGFTSESRKALKGVVEKKKSLLFYPMHYEGFEQSNNVIYMGSLPNQGVLPSVVWAFRNIGKRFAILSYDSIYSLALNELIKDTIACLGGEVVCELFLTRANPSYGEFIQELDSKEVDVIFSTQGSYLSDLFFQDLAKGSSKVQKLPIFMFNLASMRVSNLMSGKYAVWEYYEQEPTEKSHPFIKAYRERYGSEDVIDDAMVSAYLGVHLWAKAVARAGSVAVKDVLDAIMEESINGPSGSIYISPLNHHIYRAATINFIQKDGQVERVWVSNGPVSPEPFPPFRTVRSWSKLISKLESQYFHCTPSK